MLSICLKTLESLDRAVSFTITDMVDVSIPELSNINL